MAQHRLMFVGTYTEPIRFGTGQILQGKGRGIYAFCLDMTSGIMEPSGLTEGVVNPSYLAFHPSGRFLYAVNEGKEYEGAASGSVSAFALDPESGRLTFLNRKATHGTDPCHLVVHPRGDLVLVANFASGSVCVLPVGDDGALGDVCDLVQHHGSSVDPRRQAGPHAHSVTLDARGEVCYVPDLGLDRIMIYRVAAGGKLVPHEQPWIAVNGGAGPRQIVLHPSRAYAYLINELDSTMTAYRCGVSGSLHELQTLSTLPPEGHSGHTTCAEVQIAPSGAHLYGSNRGHDSIVAYTIDQSTGRLTLVGHAPSQGRTPRNFVIDPTGSFALVANQDSDNLVVFRLDAAYGRLMPTGVQVSVPTPVCVRVL